MLLVALGVLTLLSVMAVAFVTQMTLEKKAAQNYVDGVKARLIAEGALQRALEEKRQEAVASLVSTRQNLYAGGELWLPLEITADIIQPGGANDRFRPSMVGVLGQSYSRGVDRYKVKVLDTQTQFNLNNSHNEAVFKMMLRSLGQAISEQVATMNGLIQQAATARKMNDFQDLLFPVGNPIDRAVYPRLSDEELANQGIQAQMGVDAIWALREAKGGRFRTKSELLEALSNADYRLLRDFITAKSWFDPKVLDQSGPSFEAVATGRYIGGTTNKFQDGSAAQSGGPAEPTYRAPININMATRPVLLAALAPIAGRRVFYHARVEANNGLADVDTNSDFPITNPGQFREPVFGTGKFTRDPDKIQGNKGYGVRPYLIYMPPLGYWQQTSNTITFTRCCNEIADAIITYRNNAPFRNYAEWDRFVEEKCVPILWNNLFRFGSNGDGPHFAPRMKKLRSVSGAIKSARVEQNSATYSEIHTLSDQPYNSLTEAHKRFRSFYVRSYVGMLKSNFNPNGRLSQMNPDSALFVEVDKGNLRYLLADIDESTTSQPNNSNEEGEFQTLEWCFGSKGIFEIISLGELVTDLPPDVLQAYGLGGGTAAANPNQNQLVHAQEKLRSVIQIYDQITHSSQTDFLKNGQLTTSQAPGSEGLPGIPQVDQDRRLRADMDSVQNQDGIYRCNAVTYPVPMRRWLPGTPIPNQAYNSDDVGGIPGGEGGDLVDGYVQIRGFYDTTEALADASSPGNRLVFTPTNPQTTAPAAISRHSLFELLMDYYRDPASLTLRSAHLQQPVFIQRASGVDQLGQLGDKEGAKLRASMLTAEVAGGQYQSMNPNVGMMPVPLGNDSRLVFRNAPRNTFAVPIPPGFDGPDRITYGQQWLTTNNRPTEIKERWISDLVHNDGYYNSDARRDLRAIFKEAGVSVLSYRAAYEETAPVAYSPAYVDGTTAAPFTDDAIQRRARGTDKGWSSSPNMKATSGLVTFWYKPDFDWMLGADPNPRACGFFSSTHVAQPKLNSAAGHVDPRSPAPTESFRGTQSYLMRNPDGRLRFVRLYYEVAGDRDGGQANDIHDRPALRNPYNGSHPHFSNQQAGGGGQIQQIAQKEWLTVDEYRQLYAFFFTALSYDISQATDPAAFQQGGGYVPPPYYPWPPKEMSLPNGENDAAYQGGGGVDRTEIDREMQRSRLKTGRYEYWTTQPDKTPLKANQWYLFTVKWDDANPNATQLFIDNVDLGANNGAGGQVITRVEAAGASTYDAYNWSTSGGTIIPPDVAVDANLMVSVTDPPAAARAPQAPTFVRLNQDIHSTKFGALKDQLTIGSIYRLQKRPKFGLFKYEEFFRTAIPANGTIDDFIVYDAPANYAAIAPSRFNAVSRYFLQGEWAQRFDELRSLYDASGQPVRILGAYFTGYLPYDIWGQGGGVNNPGTLDSLRLQPRVVYHANTSITLEFYAVDSKGSTTSALSSQDRINSFTQVLNQNSIENPTPATNTGQTFFDLPADKSLYYHAFLNGGVRTLRYFGFGGYNGQGGLFDRDIATSTPILDGVTIVYQLPKRRILIKERVFD